MALDDAQVSLIKGMLARGDRQMDVAVYFGVNQARINEIKTGKGYGKKFRNVGPAVHTVLPPKGPYVVVSKVGYDELAAKAAANQKVVELLKNLLHQVEAGV